MGEDLLVVVDVHGEGLQVFPAGALGEAGEGDPFDGVAQGHAQVSADARAADLPADVAEGVDG